MNRKKKQWTSPQLKAWLLARHFRPNGKERRDTPFGPLDLRVINAIDRYQTDESGVHTIFDKAGNWFTYRYVFGQIDMIDSSDFVCISYILK